MLKQTRAGKITVAGICKFHCSTIPAINGSSSRMKGDFFQMGIMIARDILIFQIPSRS